MSEETARQEVRWIREIARGGRGAFEELFRAYSGRLFRYLLRYLSDPGLAEEIAQDVLVEIWRSAARYEARSRPSTWIFGIAHHKAVDALRRRRPSGEEAGEEPPPDPAAGPEDLLLGDCRREQVLHALEHLTPAHREVMMLAFFEEMSYPEIASVAGVPVNTVKTRMYHARRELRRILEEEGS